MYTVTCDGKVQDGCPLSANSSTLSGDRLARSVSLDTRMSSVQQASARSSGLAGMQNSAAMLASPLVGGRQRDTIKGLKSLSCLQSVHSWPHAQLLLQI